MEFRILGPVEVWNDGVRLPSLPPKPSQILAVLAVECGRFVTIDRLIDLIWGEAPPPQARKSLQVHISNLHARAEPFRSRDVTAAAAVGVIQGLGPRGYLMALEYLVDRDE